VICNVPWPSPSAQVIAGCAYTVTAIIAVTILLAKKVRSQEIDNMIGIPSVPAPGINDVYLLSLHGIKKP
jgi:hypothetical protein